jgi:hypothetical protein
MREKDPAENESVRSDTQSSPLEGLNRERRRALIAGLVAAPTVLSLMNRSAWAQTAEAETATSCSLIQSYAAAGHQWQSPNQANNEGNKEFTIEEYAACEIDPPTIKPS